VTVSPALLNGRARYERVMDGWVDNVHDDALTHTVRLADDDRAVQLEILALPSPSYEIRQARCRAIAGDIDADITAGFPRLAGTAMVAGLTRRLTEVIGSGAGANLVVDATVEAARLARQVAKLPRDHAERAREGARECWRLDTEGWIDLPDSCFTYSAAGRTLFESRTVVCSSGPDLYSPRPGQLRVFVRRKVARLEREDGMLRLFHSMHDDVHGFELHYEIDAASGRIVSARSLTPKLPYMGICSEPQRRIDRLVGETLDDGLRKRIQTHLGGATGCAQLYDLTSDLLKLLN
jgi:Protein of unknown function (DUF2889)